MTKREHVLDETEQRLQVVSSAVLLAHHSAFANAKEPCKCCEELESAEEQFGVAHVAAKKARDDAKTAKE